MGNMSYCRFINTLQDLQDCFEHITDTDLSEYEMKAKDQLIELCHQIVEWDNDTIDDNEDADDCQSDEYMDS